MTTPARLGHLATRNVLAARLATTFSELHQVDAEEAVDRLNRALAGPLWEALLASTWRGLTETLSPLDEEGVLNKVASSLRKRPERPGKLATLTRGLSVFLVQLDIEAGTGSDVARGALETEDGRRRAAEGLTEAGTFLAGELLRK